LLKRFEMTRSPKATPSAFAAWQVAALLALASFTSMYRDKRRRVYPHVDVLLFHLRVKARHAVSWTAGPEEPVKKSVVASA